MLDTHPFDRVDLMALLHHDGSFALYLTMLTLVCPGCRPGDDTALPAEGLIRGFGISPQGFPLDWAETEAFYLEVGAMERGGVMWNGAWRDDVEGGSDAGVVPVLAGGLPTLGETYGFAPILVFGWRSGETLLLSVPGDTTNDWSNEQARELFSTMLVEHARTTQAPWVFIGNENSAYHEQDPQDYAAWVSFYEEVYDLIKAESPSTQVGTIFNFEHLSGQGELTGWSTPHWEALEAHDLSKIDALGLTLYPFLHHATPSEVPAGYLDPLFERIGDTPLAVTETGWPAEDLGELQIPWEQSPEAQVAYLESLGGLIEGRDVPLVNWLFLHAMVDPGDSSTDWQVFGSISIRDSAGQQRPAYDAWTTFEP
jgi:hypothetical protein